MSNTGTQAVDRAAQLLTRVVQADVPITLQRAGRGIRAGPLDHVASARRAGDPPPARARRQRHVHAPARCSRSTPRGTTRGRRSRGSPARCCARSARRPARRSTSPSRAATPSSRSPRSTRPTCSARATGCRITVPAHCSALGKVLYAFGALADADAAGSSSSPRTRSPPPHDLRARVEPSASAATRSPATSSRSGSTASPPRCAVPTARCLPRSACPGPVGASATTSTSWAPCS